MHARLDDIECGVLHLETEGPLSPGQRRSVVALLRAVIDGRSGSEMNDAYARARLHELRPEVLASPERAEGIRAATWAAAHLATLAAALDDPDTPEDTAAEYCRTARRARELLVGIHDVNACAIRIAAAVRDEVRRRTSAFFSALAEDENDEIAAAAVYAFGHLMVPGAYAMEQLMMESSGLAAKVSVDALGRMVRAWPSAASRSSMSKAASHALADVLSEALGDDAAVPLATSLQNKWNLHAPVAEDFDSDTYERAVLDQVKADLAHDVSQHEAERAVVTAWRKAVPAAP